MEEAITQNNELKRRLLLLSPDAVVKPHCRKWIEIRKITDLPPKFHKGAIITLKGMNKAKVKDVFRACGLKDLIALVGPGLEGLGLPEHMDGWDHQARIKWLFNPANTGLRLVDLTNHALVLFTLDFPSEVFKSDLNP